MPETANISQLRRDIDSGRTGDKVAAPDPAAAPLGTDDEAAGTTLSSEVVEMAQKEELRAGTEAAEKPAQMSGTTIYLIAMGAFFLAVILASVSAL
jgi:hypothetical protein